MTTAAFTNKNISEHRLTHQHLKEHQSLKYPTINRQCNADKSSVQADKQNTQF